MTPEEIFVRYSLSCLEDLCDTLKQVSEEEKKDIQMRYHTHLPISEEQLRRIFPAAFRRLAERFGKDYWNMANVREYFVRYHNEYIDAGDGKYSFADDNIKYWCKVRIAHVEEVMGNIAVLNYEGHDPKRDQSRRFVNEHNLDLKAGDKVTTHWRSIIEKL